MMDSISETSLFVQELVLTGHSHCQKLAKSFSLLVSQSMQQTTKRGKNETNQNYKKSVESGKGGTTLVLRSKGLKFLLIRG